jgi:hypothetical protein
VACGATPGGAASDPDERLATGAAAAASATSSRTGVPAVVQPRAALGQPVKNWGPKRPRATRTTKASRAMRRDHLGLVTAEVRDDRPGHQHRQTDGSQRHQNRRDSERGGQDQAHRSEDFEGADGLDGAGAEVFDPSHAEGGQHLLGPGQPYGAAGQEGYGQQCCDDPQRCS